MENFIDKYQCFGVVIPSLCQPPMALLAKSGVSGFELMTASVRL
jgi:hypothetical protein